MEVILNEDVPALGKAGEVVKVAEGFGRNYLLPRKKAVLVTPGALKKLEQDKKVIEARRAKARKEAEDLAQKISAVSLTLEKQVGEENKIFGSVSTLEISKALEAQGISVDKRRIRIKDPVRALGEYTVEIHLTNEVVAALKIAVIKK